MQLSEILEENSVKAMSQKTNISEQNIEALIEDNFSVLTKAKALGFISIIERDYHADLKDVREKALAYYEVHTKENSVHLGLPSIEEQKGRSKWFVLLVLGLLGYATWYFFTQFDQKTFSTLLPFNENKTEKSLNEETLEKDLSIGNALSTAPKKDTFVKKDIVLTGLNTNKKTEETEVNSSLQQLNVNIRLVPQKRLWFGLIDLTTGKRDQFSISSPYEIDVSKKSWLLATNTAAFSFINNKETQEYNDAKEHYFKVSKEGVKHLTKEEYFALGGWKKW
jgi:hypothetical protein